MDNLLISENGIVRKAEDVQLAENVIALKNKGDLWGAIDLLIKAWADRAPEEVDAQELQIHDYRETLIDKKFGLTKGGQHTERRFVISFPNRLLGMIRAIYKSDELELDNRFFSKFAKHYPFFKVAEKN